MRNDGLPANLKFEVCNFQFAMLFAVSAMSILLGSAALCAEEPAAQQPLILRAQPIKLADKPYSVPGGAAQKGWDAYLKNDFAGAEAAFRETLKQEPKNLMALEGLRDALVA